MRKRAGSCSINFLLVDQWGGGLPITYRLIQEGHEARLVIEGKPEENHSQGMGFVQTLNTLDRPSLDWADLVVFTDGEYGLKAQEARKKGYLVWGGTPLTDKLEGDRSFGQDTMKKAGIAIVPFREFKTIDEAISYVKAHPMRYAVKLDGKQIADEKSTSYVGKEEDASDLLDMLEQFRRFGNKIEMVNLQDFVKGVEVGVAGHFNGTDFVEPIEVSFEHKSLMEGGKGPGTGEMGTTGFWTDKKSKFYKHGLEKMVPFLRKEGYIGYFCIGYIANKDNLWPLEMTCRFGYPTINLYLESVAEDFGEMLYEIACGHTGKVKMKSPFVSCLVVATPPFPFHAPDVAKKYSTDLLITCKSYEGVWPTQVYKDGEKLRCAGQDGYNLVITGSGQSMEDSLKQMYDRKKNVRIPNEMWRCDIGKTFEHDMANLGMWGYLS